MSQGEVRKRVWFYEGKKREAWGFTVIIDGKRRRRQGYASRAEAQDALDALKHPAPAAPAEVPSITLAEAFERYFKTKARKRSLFEDERLSKHLLAEFGADTQLHEITSSRIAEYQEKRLAITKSRRGGALAAATVNRPLALLRALLRLASRKWEVIAAPPVIELEKEPQGRLRWLTHEEAIRLLDACRAQKNPALVDLVELALYTGMRQGELLNLAWVDVDRARGVLLPEVTKSGRRREVPLNGPAYAVLERRSAAVEPAGLVLGNRSWDSYRKGWEAAVEAAKLDAPLRFHDLRHTFASWAVQRGVTLVELKDLLGHSTLTMVLRYAHLAPENLRAAVSRLDDVLTTAPSASSGARRTQEAKTLVASEA